MSGRQYLKNQLPVILINLLGMLALALFLLASGNPVQSILFISGIWILIVILCLTVSYLKRKKYLDGLLAMTENLNERYLIPEIMAVPQQAGEQVFYQIMKMAEKSMLEKISGIQREREEYKEYIEQWLHEVKTPITAMKLLCENNRCEFTKDILAELENVNRFTQQALYYALKGDGLDERAQSADVHKDYVIREIRLEDAVHGAIADNKYLLRQKQVAVTVDDMEDSVYTDEKWVRFILNQIISNAIKYCDVYPSLHFFTAKKGNQVILSVMDNGIGILQSDLPRIFEKGFTGQNGRRVQNSTGIGLYLCKQLCDKLGIGLKAVSEGSGGTTIVLSFQVNDFIMGVQE